MNAIDLAETLSPFSDHWHPRIVGELKGQEHGSRLLLIPPVLERI